MTRIVKFPDHPLMKPKPHAKPSILERVQNVEKEFLTGRRERAADLDSAIRIFLEVLHGFEYFEFKAPCVTVFGSARFRASHPYYKLARELGRRLAESGFAVMTGGGSGIMEAANRGAKEGGGLSLASNIRLPKEQKLNRYVDRFVEFDHFFVRKLMLVKYSCAFVVMPGGFGTLDEVFETLTLTQTKKIERFPIIAMGSEFWRPLKSFFTETLLANKTIDPKDVRLFTITDSIEEALVKIWTEAMHLQDRATERKTQKVKVILHGAAGCVTGSAYEIQTDQARLLLDFGLFQGARSEEARNRLPTGLKVRNLHAVLLTHAHLDHTGRLPLLVKAGYAGPIHATPATIEITELILRDSAKVQAHDAMRENRRRERSGRPLVEPFYTLDEVETLLPMLRSIPYEQSIPVAPGIHARYVEAGHLLGSASIELTIEEKGQKRIVVFSGDIGPKDAPILKSPKTFDQADLVFMESTYGDRDHKALQATVTEFEGIIQKAVARKGKILIPTFAVGRAQLMLHLLGHMFRKRLVPRFPVYLDSPMAIEATRIFARHPELFDDEFRALQSERITNDELNMITATPTAEDSRGLNDAEGPCLIMAGAGMCNAGRILHHLKHNLWRPETSVIIVGYQGQGSLGRRLVEGEKQVSIYGEKITVGASIHTLGGFSAHAGQTELLEWLKPMVTSRPRIVLTHGEDRAREPLAKLIQERFGLNAELPQIADRAEL